MGQKRGRVPCCRSVSMSYPKFRARSRRCGGVLIACLIFGGGACGRWAGSDEEPGDAESEVSTGITESGNDDVCAEFGFIGMEGCPCLENGECYDNLVCDNGYCQAADDPETGDESAGFVEDTGDPDCGYCDIWDEDACPEGEKCTFVSCEGSTWWETYGCRPLVGDAQVGDECNVTGEGVSTLDTCDDGLICIAWASEDAVGVCVAHCSGTPRSPTCPDGSECIWTSQDFPLCRVACDPLAQDCGEGQSCLPPGGSTGFVCMRDASGDQGAYGTPCSSLNSCDPGLLCIEPSGVPEPECAEASSCCSPLCSLAAGEPCPGQGQTCESFFESGFVPEGYEDVGLCSIWSP